MNRMILATISVFLAMPSWALSGLLTAPFTGQAIRNTEDTTATGESPTTAERTSGRADCNGNGLEDECDIDCGLPGCNLPGCGQSWDCNTNGAPDECDIAGGTSLDANANGTPDECEIGAEACCSVNIDPPCSDPPPLQRCCMLSPKVCLAVG